MTLTLVTKVLGRRWRAVLASVVAGMLFGVMFWQLMPVRYSATTSLVVSPVVSNPFTGSREDVNIRTEREILGSRKVAERASAALGGTLETDSYLLNQVDLATPSGSQVLQVSVQTGDPEQAAMAADAISAAYLDFRREGADQIAQRYLDQIDAQLLELEASERDSGTQRLIDALQEQRLNVMLSNAEPGRIIGQAVPPRYPSTPGPLITIAGGTAAGFLLGLAAALLAERLDRRVRSVDRLQRVVKSGVIISGGDDESFWAQLSESTLNVADDSERKTDPGTEPGQLKILLASSGPAVRTDAVERLSAALDKTTAEDLKLIETSGSAPERALKQERRLSTGIIDLTAPEWSLRSISRGATASDVAVVLVSRKARLRDIENLAEAIREADRELVIGLTKP